MTLSRPRAIVTAAALSVTASAAAFALYGAGRLNNDTMWSIAWGRSGPLEPEPIDLIRTVSTDR